MTMASGADVTDIKGWRKRAFPGEAKNKEIQPKWRGGLEGSGRDKHESNPTKLCGPCENKLDDLAGAPTI